MAKGKKKTKAGKRQAMAKLHSATPAAFEADLLVELKKAHKAVGEEASRCKLIGEKHKAAKADLESARERKEAIIAQMVGDVDLPLFENDPRAKEEPDSDEDFDKVPAVPGIRWQAPTGKPDNPASPPEAAMPGQAPTGKPDNPASPTPLRKQASPGQAPTGKPDNPDGVEEDKPVGLKIELPEKVTA